MSEKTPVQGEVPSHIEKYRLLDSGDGRKLEAIGAVRVDRQASVALWKKALPEKEWNRLDAFHHRSETGGGNWENKKKFPETWIVSHAGLTLKAKLTSFGHLGFFAEQGDQWSWFRETATRARKAMGDGQAPRILNLFGYTGGTSLSLALGGAEVTHVDAAKGIVDWGKENAKLSQTPEDSIRWIVDDCLAFVKREERRGKKYHGVILDPPSYGRGPNKEVFKIETHLPPLLAAIRNILEPNPVLIHLSCHSPGFTPEVLKNLLYDHFAEALNSMKIEQGEMMVFEEARNRNLPSGTFCRARSV